MAGIHAGLSREIVDEAQTALDNYDLATAESRFDYALTLDNDNEDARVGLALAKSCRGKHFEALDLIEAASESADNLAAHAVIAINAGHIGDASEIVQYALAIDDKNPQVWAAAAAVETTKGSEEGWSKAIARMSMALHLAPYETSIRMDRVGAYLALNKYDKALDDLCLILQAKPDLAPAHWNKAIALLSKGAWDGGRKEFDWRLDLPYAFSPAYNRLRHKLPFWRGEPGRLLLLQEGGFGDTIMALRYLPHVANDFTLLSLPELAPLTDYPILSEIPDDVSAWDFCLPLLSLITRFDHIPPAPYLVADPHQMRTWQDRIPAHKPRMGIAWSAGYDHSRRKVRSVPLEQLLQAFGRDFTLVSMQNHDHGRAEMLGVTTFHYNDFGELAGLMQTMDVVVSIDTAAIHLAGALGRPAHLLLDFAPEWRWAGGYPWYNSVIPHVQPTIGDWGSVINQVRAQLC